MNSIKNKVINLEISTISPVAVLDDDGKKLSPYVDIVLDDKDVVQLDKDKVVDLIINDNKAFNMYLNILRNQESNSKNHFTMSDLMHYKRIKIKDVTYRRIPCNSHIKNLTQVSTCIKSNGKAYIPGSSLKGAIRTAILYANIDKEEIVSKLYIKDKKGRCVKEYVGQDIFRNEISDIQSDIFKYLIVRDAAYNTQVKCSIYEAKSVNLYGNKNERVLKLDMPQLLECIDKGEKLNFEIIIKGDNFSKEEIFNGVNEFYEKVILKEIAEISKLYSEDKNKLINEYNLLLKRIRNLKKNKNGFIIRIGNLKGYFSNTITAELDDKSIFTIIDREKIKKRKKIGEFPTTKWVVSNNDSIEGTFGWIEVKEK